MGTPIPITKFKLKHTFPCKGYITSVDVINNIVAVTDTSNIVYVFDLYKKKQVLKLKVWKNLPIYEVKLLKKYKTDVEYANKNEYEDGNEDFDIEEFLLIGRGRNKRRLCINHCRLYNPKTLHKYIFQYEINRNGFALHPRTHIFIVALKSKQLGVYRIKDKTCIYSIKVQNQYCIPCFNKTGIIYACSSEQKYLYLYSSYADEYTEEYFAKFDISNILENGKDHCTHLDFSYDDKKIIVVTKYKRIYSIDAFHGTILYKYKYGYDAKQAVHVAYFMPRPIFSFDSNYVISGEQSFNICVWDIKGDCVCKFECKDNVSFIKWIYNRNAFIATTTHVMLWQLI